MPFIVMICIALIVVLAIILIYKAISGGDEMKKVNMYIVSGSTMIKQWGDETEKKAYNGQVVLEGDTIRTSNGGRTVLEFLDGTIVRLDKATELVVTEVEDDMEASDISLELISGGAWVRKAQSNEDSVFILSTENLDVRAEGTIFEVEAENDEIVRVIQGNVEVDILSIEDGKKKVVETLPVGISQQIIIGSSELEAFIARRNISVLEGISSTFKETDWYEWNVKEDASPTDYSESGINLRELGEDDDDHEFDEESEEGEEGDEMDEEGDGDSEVLIDIEGPRVTSHDNKDTITSSSITIKGTVPKEAEKVYVTSFESGSADTTRLNSFESGSGEFQFNASTSIGNLEEGRNKFEIYYLDEDDNKSDITEFILYYEPDEDAEDEEEDEEEEEELDLPDVALTAPKVETYNGSSSSVIPASENQVVVVGSCAASSAKIVVNGYTLSQFTPGSTSWTYYAKESVNNLKPGLNEYTVYALDENDVKSAMTDFTIIWEKEALAEEDAATPSD